MTTKPPSKGAARGNAARDIAALIGAPDGWRESDAPVNRHRLRDDHRLVEDDVAVDDDRAARSGRVDRRLHARLIRGDNHRRGKTSAAAQLITIPAITPQSHLANTAPPLAVVPVKPVAQVLHGDPAGANRFPLGSTYGAQSSRPTGGFNPACVLA